MELTYQYKTKTILTISDMHIPYHHPDSFDFLAECKKRYKPDLVVSMGDLADFHDISFHDSDPDLMSAGDEMRALQKYSKQLEKIFPKMYVIGSNHGDLPARRAFASKMPKHFLRPYNEIYGVGKGWQFIDDLTLNDGKESIYFSHGVAKDGLKLSAQRGVNSVQGHYHTEFRIDYISNPQNLLWAMHTGCLLDKRALAFAYNKLDVNRPIIGTGAIKNGHPFLIPMIIDKNHKWVR